MNALRRVGDLFGSGPKVRLPFVGPFLLAGAGCAAGQFWPWSPAWAAGSAAVFLLPALLRGSAAGLWPGILLTFMALQSGQQQWAGSKRILQSLSVTPAVLEVRGVVQEPPRPSGNAWRFPLELQKGHLPGAPMRSLRGLLTVRWPGPPPAYGDLVGIRGALQALDGPRNPGTFDYARWQRWQGVWAELRPSTQADAQVLSGGHGNPLRALAWQTREKISALLGEGIGQFPEVRALLLAMTLGSTEEIPPARLEQFRITGTLHLFSVSGLHVGMLGVLLWIALKPLRLPFPAHVLAIISLLFFYALVTGLRPASVRAAFMAAVVLGGLLLSRPAAPLNSLAAAGFFLLLADSSELFNPGFQLSFSVVAAILLVGAPMVRWLRAHAGPDPFLPRQLYGPGDKMHSWFAREAGALAAVSASAWLGSLPLIAWNYNLVSLSALPVNILAVPLAFVILAVAMLSLVSGAFLPVCAAIFNHTNVLVCSLLLGLIQFAAEVPGSSLRVGDPWQKRGDLSAVFFDFAAGESTALSDGRHVWLVDTGTDWDWRQTVSPWLARRGTTRLDGLFLTHGDARHVGGAVSAVETFRPQFVAVPPLTERSPVLRKLYELMETRALPRRLAFAGMRWMVSPDWSVEVLFPPASWQAGRADERTLVTRWTAAGLRILLLGDADLSVQDWLLQNAKTHLAADILLLGRPASGETPRHALLRAVDARAIVVAAAEFPRTEKFTPLWEETLQHTGARIFRKDRTGAVLLHLAGNKVELQSFLSPIERMEWMMETPQPAD